MPSLDSVSRDSVIRDIKQLGFLLLGIQPPCLNSNNTNYVVQCPCQMQHVYCMNMLMSRSITNMTTILADNV